MKITISGIVGSGKTTVATLISEKLNIENYYVGGIMREMAVEAGKSFQELTEDAKTDKKIDLELDRRQRALNESNGNFVMDSRLGFHFVPDSFKVFLKVDLSEAARRIFAVQRSEEKYSGEAECLEYLEKRIQSEKMRYKGLYDIDFPCEDKFDLVIDTSNKSPLEVVKLILGSIPGKSHYEDESNC